jgi:hypothetical protein
VDATPTKGSARPFEKLQITQTLDERQAADGKLILEVKATARGLVPDLENIVELDHAGFQIDKVDDQGISVSRFDPDSDATLIDSERTWLVAFRAAQGQEQPPATFRFASATVDGAELVYQRYVDADLAKVGPEISLEATYAQPRYAWLWWAGGSLLGLLLAAALVWKLFSRPRRPVARRFEMPDQITPFSVLGLLRQIERKSGLAPPQLQELAGSIDRIERQFFAESDGESIDLRHVGETWIRRAS